MQQDKYYINGDYLANDGIHHKRKTITLDGTENWATNTVSTETQIKTISFFVSINNIKNSDNSEDICLCSHLKGGITSQIYNVDKEGIWVNSNNLYIRINRDNLETKDVEGLKNYLNINNMTVEYLLKDEEIEAYTEEQQEVYNKIKKLYSYEEVTHITCEDEIKTNMQLSYFINNEMNKTYAKKIDEISSKQDKDKAEIKAQINQLQTNIENEINTKQNKITNATAQLTVGAYLGEVDINKVERYGNVCKVDFRAKILSEIGDNVNFLKLPFKSVPSLTILFGIGERYGVSDMKWAYCDTEGYIKGNKLIAGNYIHMSFTYICQE